MRWDWWWRWPSRDQSMTCKCAKFNKFRWSCITSNLMDSVVHWWLFPFERQVIISTVWVFLCVAFRTTSKASCIDQSLLVCWGSSVFLCVSFILFWCLTFLVWGRRSHPSQTATCPASHHLTLSIRDTGAKQRKCVNLFSSSFHSSCVSDPRKEDVLNVDGAMFHHLACCYRDTWVR